MKNLVLLLWLLLSYTSDVQANCWHWKNLQQFLWIFAFGKINSLKQLEEKKERRNYRVYNVKKKKKQLVLGLFFLFPLRHDSRNKTIQNVKFCLELCTALNSISHMQKKKKKQNIWKLKPSSLKLSFTVFEYLNTTFFFFFF